MEKLHTRATVLIVPGLRDHVADHWQTLLEARLARVHSVAPLTEDKLNCQARVDAIQQALAGIDGPVILVAHSAGVLMAVHWAATHRRPILGALLVTPPDLDAPWPSYYPSPQAMHGGGWIPLPRTQLPFASLVAMSRNDPLASQDAVRAMALDWGSELVDIGEVGHLNPASGFGPWPEAEALLRRLDI
ncbi:RBBP9/YdeN family alpha/beta hydrolase [Aeromonas tecta]|uniref:RBBP9/YdeN family alpha/beta hydrolase n=1 Tax=Aeromonas tecta TaxID=324617 RepID=UPI00067FE6D6|nr:alpha/beta hydrolase [Aeromonas tecta]